MEKTLNKLNDKVNVMLHHLLNPGGRISELRQIKGDLKKILGEVSDLKKQTLTIGADLGLLGVDFCRRCLSESLRMRTDLTGFKVQGLTVRSLQDLCNYLQMTPGEANCLLAHVRQMWYTTTVFKELWTLFADIVARVSQGIYGNQPPPKALCTVMFKLREAEKLMLSQSNILGPEVTTCLNVVRAQGKGFPVVMDHIDLLEEMHRFLKEGRSCTLRDRSPFMVMIFGLQGEFRHSVQLDMQGRVFRQLNCGLWSWTIRCGEIKLRYTSSSFRKAKEQLRFFQCLVQKVLHICHREVDVNFVKFVVFGTVPPLMDSVGFQNVEDICIVNASQISHLS